jgi:hypothetical protein
MPPKVKRIHVTLPDRQYRMLKKLKDELGLDQSGIVRLAISRLAQDEAERLKKRPPAPLTSPVVE